MARVSARQVAAVERRARRRIAASDAADVAVALDAVREALRPPALRWRTWEPGRAVVVRAERSQHGIRVTLRPAEGGGDALLFVTPNQNAQWLPEAAALLSGYPVAEPDPVLLAADEAEREAAWQAWAARAAEIIAAQAERVPVDLLLAMLESEPLHPARFI